MEYIAQYDSPLGLLIMTSDGDALTGLRFSDEPFDPPDESPEATDLPVFALTRTWLDTYFRGAVPGFLPPMRLRGTPFQKAVWSILLDIPYGKTVTYGSIAGRLSGGGAMSSQAVGQAVGKNPVCIIVPCHRVVGSNGRLTGYAWGLDKKEALLAMEQGQETRLY